MTDRPQEPGEQTAGVNTRKLIEFIQRLDGRKVWKAERGIEEKVKGSINFLSDTTKQMQTFVQSVRVLCKVK